MALKFYVIKQYFPETKMWSSAICRSKHIKNTELTENVY